MEGANRERAGICERVGGISAGRRGPQAGHGGTTRQTTAPIPTRDRVRSDGPNTWRTRAGRTRAGLTDTCLEPACRIPGTPTLGTCLPACLGLACCLPAWPGLPGTCLAGPVCRTGWGPAHLFVDGETHASYTRRRDVPQKRTEKKEPSSILVENGADGHWEFGFRRVDCRWRETTGAELVPVDQIPK